MYELNVTIGTLASQDDERFNQPLTVWTEVPDESYWITDLNKNGSRQLGWRAAEDLFSAPARYPRTQILLAKVRPYPNRSLEHADVDLVSGIASGRQRPTLARVKKALPFYGVLYATPSHSTKAPDAVVVLFFDRPHTLAETLRVKALLSKTLSDAFTFLDPLVPLLTPGYIKSEASLKWCTGLDGKRLSIDLLEPAV
jgi:hypothetical protein